MNYVGGKVKVLPLHELRLVHFTASNFRRGTGGDIDYVAASPNGIVWTVDFNKNMPICIMPNPATLMQLPTPSGFPEFDGRPQVVKLLPQWCTDSNCWHVCVWKGVGGMERQRDAASVRAQRVCRLCGVRARTRLACIGMQTLVCARAQAAAADPTGVSMPPCPSLK